MESCIASETSASLSILNDAVSPRNQEDLVLVDRGSLPNRISDLYGEDIKKMCRLFDNVRVKRSRALGSLAFLKRCRDNGVIPACATLHFHGSSNRIKNILRKSSFQILKNHIAETRNRLDFLNKQLLDLHLNISSKLNKEDWDTIDRISFENSEKVLHLVTENHIKKFDKMYFKNNSVKDLDTDKLVVNLSDKQLDQPTTS